MRELGFKKPEVRKKVTDQSPDTLQQVDDWSWGMSFCSHSCPLYPVYKGTLVWLFCCEATCIGWK
jgi:hypothetical protein